MTAHDQENLLLKETQRQPQVHTRPHGGVVSAASIALSTRGASQKRAEEREGGRESDRKEEMPLSPTMPPPPPHALEFLPRGRPGSREVVGPRSQASVTLSGGSSHHRHPGALRCPPHSHLILLLFQKVHPKASSDCEGGPCLAHSTRLRGLS